MTRPRLPPTETLAGHYAGAVSRVAAYVVDALLVSGVYVAGVQATLFVWDLVVGGDADVDQAGVPFAIGFAFWSICYYVYPWAISGKTPGKALLGLRVVRRDGADLSARGALRRYLGYVLSVATLGIGFALLLVTRDRRNLPDILAGSAVVYDWDARAARLRFLARHSDTGR